MILSFYSQKGGTGKTTSAYFTAHILAQRGYKVLALDLDPQANLTYAFGLKLETPTILQVAAHPRNYKDYLIEIAENLHTYPGDIRMATANLKPVFSFTERVAQDYDFVLLDLPPELSELTIGANSISDGAIIPLTLDVFAYDSIGQFKDTYTSLKTINPKFKVYGVLRTMGARSNISSVIAELMATRVKADLQADVFTPIIRRTEKSKEYIAAHSFPTGKPTGIIQDYNDFVDEFISFTEKGGKN